MHSLAHSDLFQLPRYAGGDEAWGNLKPETILERVGFSRARQQQRCVRSQGGCQPQWRGAATSASCTSAPDAPKLPNPRRGEPSCHALEDISCVPSTFVVTSQISHHAESKSLAIFALWGVCTLAVTGTGGP
eukprot:5902084-Pyramimonas_sp.AAC.1